jgi:rubrerythrin
MYYCNNCDIAHEERNCPLCEANKEIKSLEKRIEELEDQLN